MSRVKMSWDNEEIQLERNGKYVYVFSRSEFEAEYEMTVEDFNFLQEKENTGLKAVVHTWKTEVS